MNTEIFIRMNDCFSPDFQSHLDPYFRSFPLETRRGGWFRHWGQDEARSALALALSKKAKPQVIPNSLRIEITRGAEPDYAWRRLGL